LLSDLLLAFSLRVLIADNNPLFLSDCAKSPSSFNIWLIEAREDEMGIIWLELRVDILKLVLLVGKRVQTHSIFAVLVQDVHRNLVSATPVQSFCRKVNFVVVEDVCVAIRF